MRNNPYNKNTKDHLPLFMQGPSSINVFIANETQKDILEKAITPPKKAYQIKGVSFTTVRPPILNKNFTVNPTNLLNIEMGQTEVTQELFEAVMRRNDSENSESPQNPVENVTWYDCIAFCNKLSTLLGLEKCYKMSYVQDEEEHIIEAKVQRYDSKNGFRLPTEKEWEIFAKAGTNNIWSGTDDEKKLNEYAWYDDNAVDETHPVGEKLPNEWGLYDMTGNVWEWCWDLYDPEDEERRAVRGGSYLNDDDACLVTYRNGGFPDLRICYVGLRLCRSLG